jgi:FkbM family methyltransferase
MRNAWLRRTFQNGEAFINVLKGGPEPTTAILQNGQEICQPAGAAGLLDAILEIWFNRAYMPSGFYTPKPGDVIIDAGANVGVFTLYALRQFTAARVVAIEPFPENFDCLVRNLSVERGAGARCAAHRLALSGVAGTGTMARVGERSLDHVLQTGGDPKNPPVEMIPLAGVCELAKTERVAFLKVDVEGSERAIFEAADCGTLRRFDRIAAEYHDNLIPGCLETMQARLAETHHVVVRPAPMRTCGLVFAARKKS